MILMLFLTVAVWGQISCFTNLRSVRGELIWLHAEEVKLSRAIRFLHPRYRIYLSYLEKTILIYWERVSLKHMIIVLYLFKTTLELLTAAYYIHPGFCRCAYFKNGNPMPPDFGTSSTMY